MATTEKKSEKMTDAFETMTASTPEFFKEGYEKVAENVTAIADFQKASFEAIMESANLFTKGIEKAASTQASFVKESFDESVAAAKKAAAAKTVQDAFTVQSDYVQASLQKNIGQANETAEHWVSLSKEAAAPLTKQYGTFVEKAQAFRP